MQVVNNFAILIHLVLMRGIICIAKVAALLALEVQAHYRHMYTLDLSPLAGLAIYRF